MRKRTSWLTLFIILLINWIVNIYINNKQIDTQFEKFKGGI